jgi:hypothetical protein
MFKLIYKDLYQLRKPYLLYSGMLLGLSMLADSFASGAFLALYLVVAVYGLTLRSAYYEDKDNALTFLRTLPIQAKTIVIAKYMTVALLLLLVGLFAVAVAAVFHLMGTPLEADLLSLYLWATAGIMVLVSVFLAVFFRWGYNRAVNTIRLLFLSLFFIPIIISPFQPGPPATEFESGGDTGPGNNSAFISLPNGIARPGSILDLNAVFY